MSELEKMLRVMKKLDPAAPHAVLLVLDATVGQNALSQVEVFGKDCGGDRPGRMTKPRRHRARRHPGVDCREGTKLPIHFIGRPSARASTTSRRSRLPTSVGQLAGIE